MEVNDESGRLLSISSDYNIAFLNNNSKGFATKMAYYVLQGLDESQNMLNKLRSDLLPTFSVERLQKRAATNGAVIGGLRKEVIFCML